MTLKRLVFAVVLACAGLQVHAIGRLADITITDRQTGATLPVYHHQGQAWVAGQPGARYSISVRNRLGERVMAVASVDGVNVLSGETAGWDQSGYVFSAWRQYQITGWRKSNSEVAAFEFSAAGDSYAGRTGRPDHVGVIGVALYREKIAEPVAQAPRYDHDRSDPSRDGATRFRQEHKPVPHPGTETASAPAAAKSAESAIPGSAADSGASQRSSAAPTAKLGTAHGRREHSVVADTRFERLQTSPDEVIQIRYDSRENLVASGVIREPAQRPAPIRPNPFPGSDSASFVPDPPARRY